MKGLNVSTHSLSQLPYVRFDSQDVTPADRYDYWQTSLSSVCQLSFPYNHSAESFVARNEMWILGDMMLSRRECSAHILHRSSRSIRLDQLDHYKIHFRVGGSADADLEAGRQAVHVDAGGCVLTDMARPERVQVDGGTTVTVIIPRDRLDALLPHPVDLHGVVLRGGCTVLLADHLRSLTRSVDQLTLEQAPDVALATLHLLAASIAPSMDKLALARPAIEATLLSQIRRHIEEHIGTSELTVEHICTRFRISRATLYRLFEPMGGVAKFIKERRLFRIHTVLATAEGRPHLNRVAEQYGFKTSAHFSRAFREQFGYSPSELTSGARRELPSAASATARFSMERWLHSLRA
jgi:AraC-like DNA-binding protein